MFTAFILAGGLGTRLGSLTKKRPKPLLTVHKTPFIEYKIRHLNEIGILDIRLICSYKFEQFLYLKDKFNLQILVEGEPIGTFGYIKKNIDNFPEKFMVLNGDTYFDVSPVWSKIATSRNAIFTYFHSNADRYGSIILDQNNHKVISITEKGTNRESLINAGIYIFNKADVINFKKYHKKLNSSLENDFLPYLVSNGLLDSYQFKDQFLDIGTKEDFQRAEKIISRYR